ncbi:MAG: hypothetical protein PHW04_15840 [Candidatus Wallbacteria bacterium]|nr:hypothetical protein [Candidatus Wallbacteria bacterium]
MYKYIAIFLASLLMLAVSGCGGGGGGGESAMVGADSNQSTVPLKISVRLVDSPFTGLAAPGKELVVAGTTETQLESAGKMGIMIWQICGTSQLCAPQKEAAPGIMKSTTFTSFTVPTIGQTYTINDANFKFMGGAFVDYVNHEAVVSALPGSSLYIFSYALLMKGSSWEPAYVGVDTIEVSKTQSNEKCATLYQGSSISSQQLTSVGLSPNLNVSLLTNPQTIVPPPTVTSLVATNPDNSATTFTVGDPIKGTLTFSGPVGVTEDYYYWATVTITKVGSSTSLSKTSYLYPNTAHTTLLAYDSEAQSTPVTDFSMNSTNTAIYFHPTSSYQGYLNTDGTLKSSGTYNFSFSFYSNLKSTPQTLTRQVVVSNPVTPPPAEYQAFNISSETPEVYWGPTSTTDYGSVADESNGFTYDFVHSGPPGSNGIYAYSIVDLGTSLTAIPLSLNPGVGTTQSVTATYVTFGLLNLYLSAYNSSGIQPVQGHYYGYIPCLYNPSINGHATLPGNSYRAPIFLVNSVTNQANNVIVNFTHIYHQIKGGMVDGIYTPPQQPQPNPVASFVALPWDSTEIDLYWKTPADLNGGTSVEIRRLSGTTAPATTSQGTLITRFTAATGTLYHYYDTSVSGGQVYSYTAFIIRDSSSSTAVSSSIKAQYYQLTPLAAQFYSSTGSSTAANDRIYALCSYPPGPTTNFCGAIVVTTAYQVPTFSAYTQDVNNGLPGGVSGTQVVIYINGTRATTSPQATFASSTVAPVNTVFTAVP